ncbi:MAG: minor capsid protein [Paraclostridium sp.]
MARTYTNNQFPKYKTDLVNDRGGYDLDKIKKAFWDSNIWDKLETETDEDKRRQIAETLANNKDYNFSKVKDREKKYMDDAKKVNARLQRQYEKAIKETQDDIMALYDKITKDMGYLNTRNLSKEEQLKIAEKISLNGAKLMGLDGELKNMESKVDTLYKSYNQSIGKHLKNVFTGSYNDSFKDAKNYLVKDKYNVTDLGKGLDARAFQDRLVEESVRTSWGTKNLNFSDSIWKQQDKLKADLRDTITQGFIKGQTSSEMATKIAERYGVAHSRAKTLVQTETNRVFNQAQTKSLLDQGYEEGEISSIGDDRTSKTCRNLDGTIITLKDAMAGVNAPPFHPNCRSIVVPKIEGQEVLQRWSKKDEDTYGWDDLPSDMQDDILSGKSVKQAVGFDAPNVKVPKDTFDKLTPQQQDMLKRNGLYGNVSEFKKPTDKPKIKDKPKLGENGKPYFGDEPLKFDKDVLGYSVDNHLGFNSVSQAEDYLRDNLGVGFVDLDAITNEALISTTNILDTMYDKFPNMRNKIGELITEKHSSSSNALAWCQPYQWVTNPDGSGGYKSRISLVGKYYNRKGFKKFTEDYIRDAKQKWHPKGTTWEDTFIHEFGHALHFDLYRPGFNEDVKALKNIRKQAIANITGKKKSELTETVIKDYLKFNLCEYGSKTQYETFAEAFSDYITNGENANEFSKEFFKLVLQDKKDYIKNSSKKNSA